MKLKRKYIILILFFTFFSFLIPLTVFAQTNPLRIDLFGDYNASDKYSGISIEGLYSADGNFIADGDNSCAAGSDKRLNIAGTVMANAGRNGKSFVNNRTLCGNNEFYPSVTFTERPDFILNYPSMVKQIPRFWQDIAP